MQALELSNQLSPNSSATSNAIIKLNSTNQLPYVDLVPQFSSTGSNNLLNNTYRFNSGSQNQSKLNIDCTKNYNEYFPSSQKLPLIASNPNNMTKRFQSGSSKPIVFNYPSYQGISAEETQFNSANSNMHPSVNCFSSGSFVKNENIPTGNNPSAQFDKFLTNFKIGALNGEPTNKEDCKEKVFRSSEEAIEKRFQSQKAPLHSKLNIKLENNAENEMPFIVKAIIDSKLKQSFIADENKVCTKSYHSAQNFISKYEQEWLLYLQTRNEDEFNNL